MFFIINSYDFHIYSVLPIAIISCDSVACLFTLLCCLLMNKDSSFYTSFFCDIAFCALFKKIFLTRDYEDTLLSTLLFKNYNFAFVKGPYVPGVDLVYGVKWGSNFILFPYGYSIVPAKFTEILSFCHCYTLPSLSEIKCLDVCWSVSIISSLFH